MPKEFQSQVEVSIGLKTLWHALSKNLTVIIPKVIPNVVKDMKVVEGNGGIGTIFFFNFFPEVTHVSSQKEKIAVLDENNHEIGLQVIEGGLLNLGFSHYRTTFQLSAIEENKTLVSVKVSFEYESNREEDDTLPLKTAEFGSFLFKSLEAYLLNDAKDN